ncbi:O-methyltransferase [Aspergillus varians]
MSAPDFESLGANVSTLCSTIAARLKGENQPLPSFAPDSPARFPNDPLLQKSRQELITILTDLLYLASGPADYLFIESLAGLLHDATVVNILNEFNFFSAVPEAGSASFSEIARATTVPESLVRRILRYAFTMRFFALDSDPDRVVHTALSAHMLRSPEMRAWVGHHMEEGRDAATKTVEAIRTFSAGRAEATEDLHETAFGLSWQRTRADGTLTDFFSMGDDDPARGQRFTEAMLASVGSGMVSGEETIEHFDWERLGTATLVDVGGSDGALATILARKYPQLTCIVQDLPRLEAEFKAHLADDVADRVTFQAQDFFKAQPQKADIFLMKHILHNWSDKYAVQILRNLVAALHPGGHILICDGVVPAPEEAASLPLKVRKGIAAADIHMFSLLNAPERTLKDWEATARKADARLKLQRVDGVPGALVHLLRLKLED